MSFRGFFALLVCFVFALAGCQKSAPEAAPEPDNIDGRKVLDALSSSLMKATAERPTPAPNVPGDAPSVGVRAPAAPDAP